MLYVINVNYAMILVQAKSRMGRNFRPSVSRVNALHQLLSSSSTTSSRPTINYYERDECDMYLHILGFYLTLLLMTKFTFI